MLGGHRALLGTQECKHATVPTPPHPTQKTSLFTAGRLLEVSPYSCAGQAESCARSPDDVRVLAVLPLALLPFSVHHRGVHVGRREGVGLIQQGDHTQEDGSVGPWVQAQLPTDSGDPRLERGRRDLRVQGVWGAHGAAARAVLT